MTRASERLKGSERHVAALKLRREGKTYAEIATELKFNDKAAAHKAIMSELERAVKEPTEAVMALELERCDALIAAAWPDAMAGDPKAIHAILRVMDRRAKLLGLDDYEARMATVAERRVAVEEAEAIMLLQVLQRVFARLDLTEEQRALVEVVVPEEFKAIEAAS